MDKPYSPSCERNRDPILDVLRVHFTQCRQVLEIGSGTGQHAVHFAAAMPWLTWQCSDRVEHLPGLRMWLDEAGLSNTPPPVDLDVRAPGPPAAGRFDAVFSANTLHIMSWAEVEAFFDCVDALVEREPGMLVVYGPFNQGGAFTSASNRDFDAALRAREPHMGIRDLEAVDTLARGIGMRLQHDLAMPANNRCLVWRRQAVPSFERLDGP
ncbi:MAG: DUF938 domain-containing protein [Luteimonas sp.]